jgi:hypothetical protein
LPNQQYSSASAYRALFHGQCDVPSANILHKTRATPSSKFFVWLAPLDRCWTGDQLLCHHMKDNASCIFCDQANESIDHLLLGCYCTREVWARRLARSGHHDVSPSPGDRIADWWIATRKKNVKSSCKGFDSLVVLVWWFVWKECNNMTFNEAMQQATTLASWIREEAKLWVHAGVAPSLSLLV